MSDSQLQSIFMRLESAGPAVPLSSTFGRSLVGFNPQTGLFRADRIDAVGRCRVLLMLPDLGKTLLIDVSALSVKFPRQVRVGGNRVWEIEISFAIHCPLAPKPYGVPAKIKLRARPRGDNPASYELLVVGMAAGDIEYENDSGRSCPLDSIWGVGWPIKRRTTSALFAISYPDVVRDMIAGDAPQQDLRAQLWGTPDRHPIEDMKLHAVAIRPLAKWLSDIAGVADGSGKPRDICALGISGRIRAEVPLSVCVTRSIVFETETHVSIRPVVPPDGQSDARLTSIADGRGVPRGDGARQLWNSQVCQPFIDSMRLITGRRHVTFLPQFEFDAPADRTVSWRLRWLIEDPIGADVRTTPVADRGTRRRDCTAVSYPVLEYAGHGLPAKLGLPEPASDAAVFTFQFPNLAAQDGTALRWYALLNLTRDDRLLVDSPLVPNDTLWPTPDPEAVEGDLAGGVYLIGSEVRPSWATPEVDTAVVRIGAIDLVFPAQSGTRAADYRPFKFKAVLRHSKEKHPPAGVKAEIRVTPEISNHLSLSLSNLAPGADDPLPVERLRAPVSTDGTLVLQTASDVGRVRSIVDVTESSGTEAQAHILLLNVRRDPDAGAQRPQSLVVLQPTPFSLARVDVALGAPINAAESEELAKWTADAGWHLASLAPIAMTLPPQAVGEPFLKGDFVVGYPKRDTDRDKNQPGDTRFSPPTKVTLRASRQSRNLQTVPWNLRRIFGQAGEETPGAVLDELRMELLYGMTCHVAASNLRLAEMFARIGDPVEAKPDPQLPWRFANKTQREHFAKFVEARKKFAFALENRLAVLEPYDDRISDDLRLDSDVRYQIRNDRSGLIMSVNPELRTRPMRNPFEAEGAETPWQLPGGAIWGFEVPKIVDNLLHDVDSGDAQLVAPRLSALGGWGHQRGVFDGGRSTIQSDTTMGRVSTYSIERIGRIGVLWNRAKHVIVYERTVVDSNFFIHNAGHTGLPLVRKVLEYVEILRPVRRYPDFGESPAHVGFVAGCEFKTVRMNVRSEWGTQRPEGWSVPLWRQGLDERIYPKPKIDLFVSKDAVGGLTRRQHDEPDKLVFFTNTQAADHADLSDTDAWAQVRAVDYPDARVADPGYGLGDDENDPTKVPTLNPNNPDNPLPDASAHMPGWEQFTWALNPDGEPANLLAGRIPGETIVITLRNVTMARSEPMPAPVPVSGPAQAPANIVELVQTAGDAVGKAAGVAQMTAREVRQWLDDPKINEKALREKATEFRNGLAAKAASITAPLVILEQNWRAHLPDPPNPNPAQPPISAWDRELTTRLEDGVKVWADRSTAVLDDLSSIAQARAAKLAENITPAARTEFINHMVADVGARMPHVPTALEHLEPRLRDLSLQVQRIPDQLQTGMATLNGQLQGQIANLDQ